MHKQLLLIEDDKEGRLERQIEMLESKYENLRKSIHAKTGGILKICLELKSENEFLKSAMCKNKPIYRENLF